ncbi:MAG: glutamine--fructose-6-phosphate transaminase (isomerizing) [Cellvibrionaceae bacterium]
MCGIVGAVAQRNVTKILIEGLKRLEYRGYDSAGICVNDGEQLLCRKKEGKVANLEELLGQQPAQGTLGIAHTRWATHGKPSDRNSHPHLSGSDIAIVHNGIIENHQSLRNELKAEGYEFLSDTDTEVIVHLLHKATKDGTDLLVALQNIIPHLEGAYSIAAIQQHNSKRMVVARSGSPLVIGVGIEENFIASDQLALRQVTDRIIFLEEGDVANLTCDEITIYDKSGENVAREIEHLKDQADSADKGHYRHYMLKEIFEQPRVIKQTIEGRISDSQVLTQSFGTEAQEIFSKVKNVQIIACGTSYHAGYVAKYWLEDWAGIPCNIEVASEYRYRKVVVAPDTLFITISQSGETADTLAALRKSKELGYLGSLCICNVPNSSLVRESDLCLMTLAGAEIGVASTKAFTTQLVALQILALALGSHHGLEKEKHAAIVQALHQLPDICDAVLKLDVDIEKVSEAFVDKHHTLFLGRGVQYPVAMEGALKLKEISYIHAEAYPSGELKHGPLALVDDDMPVVAVAPGDELLDKLKSNLEEVHARGGKLFVFAEEKTGFESGNGMTAMAIPKVPESLAPIVYTLPLQLLSYHVAVMRGTDVDQPRNLAKSVTVE